MSSLSVILQCLSQAWLSPPQFEKPYSSETWWNLVCLSKSCWDLMLKMIVWNAKTVWTISFYKFEIPFSFSLLAPIYAGPSTGMAKSEVAVTSAWRSLPFCGLLFQCEMLYKRRTSYLMNIWVCRLLISLICILQIGGSQQLSKEGLHQVNSRQCSSFTLEDIFIPYRIGNVTDFITMKDFVYFNIYKDSAISSNYVLLNEYKFRYLLYFDAIMEEWYRRALFLRNASMVSLG